MYHPIYLLYTNAGPCWALFCFAWVKCMHGTHVGTHFDSIPDHKPSKMSRYPCNMAIPCKSMRTETNLQAFADVQLSSQEGKLLVAVELQLLIGCPCERVRRPDPGQ